MRVVFLGTSAMKPTSSRNVTSIALQMDRDLWLFHLDGTREIQANLFSYPYDFGVWDTLMATDVQSLRADGAAIERKRP